MSTASDGNSSESSDLEALMKSFIEEQRKFNDEVRGYIKQSDTRYRTISRELGVLKGGFTFNTATANLSPLADRLGFWFISQVAIQQLEIYANLAAAAGEPTGEVASFRQADVVILVQDSNRAGLYIAVEASYSVGREDIRRAKRNAEYLQRFSSMPSRGAVVGVEIPETIRHEADANQVLYTVVQPT